MIRSMTGFARVRKSIGSIDVVISLKSVNHRGLDLQFHMSSELDPFENAMRSAIKRHVTRGHVDVRVSLTRLEGVSAIDIDSARLRDYIAAFRRAAQEYALDCSLDLNSALRIPGILREGGDAEFPPDFEAGFVAALEEALRLMNQFRGREGGELAAVMKKHNNTIQLSALKMEALRETALAAFHTRLKERLAELLDGGALDAQRLAQEAAVLADRSDIGEEVARLKIHAKQLETILDGESDIGKKLDFLLQEMNRESNTILSKTSGIGETGLGITDLALAAKSDIEKIREQSLNLE
jgi:uncharacterized protein (TIGR00255 family)